MIENTEELHGQELMDLAIDYGQLMTSLRIAIECQETLRFQVLVAASRLSPYV